MYKFVKLPLAVEASDDEKQELYNELKVNNRLWNFVKDYSNYDDFPDDECIICGEAAGGCNCDGYFDRKRK